MFEIVEFRHLKYIVAVAEAGNFTRAAKKLFLSQPALSKQIKDIERAIGVLLFDRTRNGVIPTVIGQMIVDYAIATLSGRQHVFSIAKEITRGRIPPLRLGFSCFVNSRHLQAFRSGYNQYFPSCGLQLSGGDPVHVLQRMERGDLDCAVLPMPVSGPPWIVERIASTLMVACMRSDDVLAQKTEIFFADVASRLTVFRDPDGHPAAHARLVQLIGEAGHEVHISCSAATPHDIQLLVRDGYGIALVNEDMPLESEITTRRIAGIHWTADTAFVLSSAADHPALPYISRQIFTQPTKMFRKSVPLQRAQLPLLFNLSA